MFKKFILLTFVILIMGLIGSGTAFGEVIDIRIVAGNDDGEDHIAYGDMADDGAESRGSSDLEMPWEGGVQSSSLQVIGLRFTDIPIPKGATVVNAYVEFTGDNDDDDKLVGGPVNLIINGLLQPNPDGLGSGENFFEREPKTDAEVSWMDIPEWTNNQATLASRTPDISSIILEIISQEDWTEGNSLMLFFRDDETNPSAATRSALSGDEGPAVAPLLHIIVAEEVDIPVANGGDDAEQHLDDGDMDIGSSDLELVYEDAGDPTTDEQVIGLRFVDIPLDKGAPVINAYVEVTVDRVNKQGTEAPVNLIIEGELVSNAAPFEDVANNITDRAVTVSQVKWSIPAWTEENAKFQTPDISSILQEIVNQEGWVSGNAIVLIFRDDKDNPSTGLRESESYDGAIGDHGDVTKAPLLHMVAELTVIEVASAPIPADGSEGVAIGTTLSWTPNSTAVSHDVYFGASSPPEFVSNQDANTYYPGRIEPDTIYYWQIDEVQADGTIIAGDIWSFTTGVGNVVARIRIANGSDDAEEGINPDGRYYNSSSDLEIVDDDTDNGGRQLIGMNFRDVPIPPGTEIESAFIEFVCDETKGGTDDAYLLLWGHLAPNPDGFDETSTKLSERPRTEAEVPWEPDPWDAVGQEIKTVNIASIIQELVNQDGWTAGNAIEIIIGENPDNPEFMGVRCAEAYDGSPAQAPLLQITAISEAATQPYPANGAFDVPLDTKISWWPGFSAVSQDVYFGTSSPPPLMGNTTEVSYEATGLKPSTKYYLQINSVAADGTVYAGDIWSFTTVIGEATQPDPADGALIEQRSATLSWTAGVTAASHDVYIGVAFDDVNGGVEGTFIGNQTGTALDVGLPGGPLADGLVPGTTYYWRVDEVEADGATIYKGTVWSYMIAPLTAYNPNPPDGAELASDAAVLLSWSAGMDAKLHSVYFGDDLDTVTNATGAPPGPNTTYNPGQLEAGKTYYWRVDEFNPPNSVKGEVWSFSLAPL